jgi:RNA polymerase sigma-70 factor (ECF subfamily)
MEDAARVRLAVARKEPVHVTSPTRKQQAFHVLVDELLDPSYRLASVLLGDRSEAEDATHDAVVRAWHAFDDLRDPGRFRPWFQRIVVNVCRDRLRRRQTQPSIPLLPELTVDAPATDPASGFPERDALEQALRSLSPDHRIVIVLRFYADLPIDQIAQRLGRRTGTVKSQLHHALKALRAAYDAGTRPPWEMGR